MPLYDHIDINDEEVSSLIRFLAALESADEWIRSAMLILDESDGEPHIATQAAIEAASAALAAAARSEVLDPWWSNHQPPVSELSWGLTPAERTNEAWQEETERMDRGAG